jgi:hypothetical protein
MFGIVCIFFSGSLDIWMCSAPRYDDSAVRDIPWHRSVHGVGSHLHVLHPQQHHALVEEEQLSLRTKRPSTIVCNFSFA